MKLLEGKTTIGGVWVRTSFDGTRLQVLVQSSGTWRIIFDRSLDELMDSQISSIIEPLGILAGREDT